MEWMVIGAYLVGMLLGGMIGYGCGKEHIGAMVRLRSKLQEWSDAVESRLKDKDFETSKDYGRSLGSFDTLYRVMDYIDNELYKDED